MSNHTCYSKYYHLLTDFEPPCKCTDNLCRKNGEVLERTVVCACGKYKRDEKCMQKYAGEKSWETFTDRIICDG
jgi:hypothetical protein